MSPLEGQLFMAMVDLDGDGCLSMREVDEGVRECREVDTLVAGGTGAGERGQAQELTGHVHRMQGQPGVGWPAVCCVSRRRQEDRSINFACHVSGLWLQESGQPCLPACLPS